MGELGGNMAQSHKKAALALALMICAIAAVSYLGNVGHETVRETNQAELEKTSEKLLASIQELRAYALIARDKAVDFKSMHSSGDTALVNFLIAFGEGKAEKKDAEAVKAANKDMALLIAEGKINPATAPAEQKFNVIVHYAKCMGETRQAFPEGINAYVLEHLDDAVTAGESVMKRYNFGGLQLTGIDSDEIGLNQDAKYLKKLAVPTLKYASEINSVQERSDHADVQAAAIWLLSGEKEQYKSFMDRAKEKVAERTLSHQNTTIESSLKAIQHQFEQSGDLGGLPSAGNSAAAAVPALEVPSDHEIKAAAEADAKQWATDAHSNNKDTPEAEKQSQEEQSEEGLIKKQG